MTLLKRIAIFNDVLEVVYYLVLEAFQVVLFLKIHERVSSDIVQENCLHLLLKEVVLLDAH
jgi:hypothetical protein